jgi:general secretion pathway protein K
MNYKKHKRAVRPLSAGIYRECGFALLIVLWALVLIVFIVVHVCASGRTEIRISDNLVANAVADAAADGAISEAIYNLSGPKPDQHWPIGAMTHQVKIGHSLVTVSLQDEASWINPNSAPSPLIEALLRTIGRDPTSAQSLAVAIAEWVGSASVVRPQSAILADYRAAGLDYGPPGAPLETLDELGRVIGMTPSILAAIRPHLTLFGPAEPNPASADPIVAQALAQVVNIESWPVANQPPPDLITTRITAIALGLGNARMTRCAVVRFGPMLVHGYEILFWGRVFE